MSSESYEIVCRACQCAVETVEDPKPEDVVSCPGCGTSDRFDVVMENVADEYAQKVGDSLLGEFAKTFQNSKFIQVDHSSSPESAYKFTFKV